MNYITNFNKLLKQLIFMVICITAVGMFFPLTSTSFGPWYGSIAKYIALSNNWSDLMLSNKDWLDKPHFPFWASAASFKIFGINSFAYILPGFIFHLIGAYYTYRLTNFLYKNQTTALLATLIYLSVFHLMMSAIDVRAEAYLLGQIMPAVYYWLRYNEKFTIKHLLLGALFTGMALMTKGVFVIITIVSGVFCLWVYDKKIINIINPKWWLALTLSFAVTLPEIIALYLQFDIHPEKVVFNHTNVSGIRWFLIDSQFGRFFGTGYIVNSNPNPAHWIFFIHTYLWAFLPWTFVFPAAIYYFIKTFKQLSIKDKRNFIFLMGNFWISFIMFSATSFQVDHYINIIFPFAAIVSAQFMIQFINKNHVIFKIQQYLSILIMVLLAIIIGLLFTGFNLYFLVSLEIIAVLILAKFWGQTPFLKAIMLPVFAISLVATTYLLLSSSIYSKYDAGILAAKYTSQKSDIPVVDYKFDSRSLEFYMTNKYYLEQDLSKINLERFYIVTKDENLNKIKLIYPNAQIESKIYGGSPEQVIPKLINPAKLDANLDTYDIILVNK